MGESIAEVAAGSEVRWVLAAIKAVGALRVEGPYSAWETPEYWLPGVGCWVREDGSYISFDIRNNFHRLRPNWLGRWRIRRALRNHLISQGADHGR